jgi:phosphoserine phosphatase
VRFATDAVRRSGPEAAARRTRGFMREVIARLRPEALALVRSTRQAGDQVLIVTATNEFVTRPIAQALA